MPAENHSDSDDENRRETVVLNAHTRRTSLLIRLVLIEYCLMIVKYWKGGSFGPAMQQIDRFFRLPSSLKS